jgi:hypothetical protein
MPPPPGAVCHPNQPTYNPAACPAVQAGWLTTIWHTDNPVSSIENNWNNDTCLPYPTVPCSGEGYPVYVVNATSAEDVKKGVDFARENNVRLIVKGTGHDYLGRYILLAQLQVSSYPFRYTTVLIYCRSSAPNSLSIWTHYLQGVSFHDGFQPQGCKYSIDTAAITAAAGVQMLEIDYEASLRNLTIVSGGAGTVGLGGYLTGGGHGALSLTYGLAADQVLEIEMVTPGGKILTVNECQHKDLFWAMRGVSILEILELVMFHALTLKQGGGSTFGVITSVTFKAFPSTPYASAIAFFATVPGTEAFWDATANVLSQFPQLNDQGISGYTFIAPKFTSAALNITTPVDAYYGIFNLPLLYPGNSSASLAAAISDVFANATAAYPFQFMKSVIPTLYKDFYSWYAINNGPLTAGTDIVVGSRLLDEEALTSNLTAVIEAFKTATPPGSVSSVYLVGGKGVWDVVPRGGSAAVNPAWRKALVHSGTSLLSPLILANRRSVHEPSIQRS